MRLPGQRHIAALSCVAVLATACGTPADRKATPAREATAARNADGPASPPKHSPAKLAPAEALTPQAQGKRVHWRGGISAIEAQEGARQCFTLLYAISDERGMLQWPRDEQMFIACGPGYYDRSLVAQFTLLTLDGRVSGQRMFLGKPVPVIEIDALYRHSDCVQGSEQSPECYSGLLQPRKP